MFIYTTLGKVGRPNIISESCIFSKGIQRGYRLDLSKLIPMMDLYLTAPKRLGNVKTFDKNTRDMLSQSHRIHVWNLCLHLVDFYGT